jgi:hypothetical protein
MRIHIPCTALGLAAAAFVPAAHAETIVTRQIVDQPVETVRTVTTTRTIRPARHHSVVETRRTTVTDRAALVGARAAVAAAPPPVVPAPAPVYDAAVPVPAVAAPAAVYDDDDDAVVGPAPVPAPVVDAADVAPPPPVFDQAPVPPGLPVGTVMPAYRYVYQWDRILVIDPVTGIAVQSLPR